MLSIREIIVSLWEFVQTEAAKLLKVAINTLTAGPTF